jgi:hypothetical protein
MPNVSPRPEGRARPSGVRLHEPQPSIGDSREAASLGSSWARFLTWRWLIAALAIILLLDATIIYWFRFRTADDAPAVSREIALGSFEFARSNGEQQIYRGQFDLFVRLSDRLDRSQRRQFLREQPRLQKAVEETLRHLRLADFTDLRLTRLKNRVQERLDDEFGFDAVEEVLIADFKIAAFRLISKQTQQPASPSVDGSLNAPQPLPAD